MFFPYDIVNSLTKKEKLVHKKMAKRVIFESFFYDFPRSTQVLTTWSEAFFSEEKPLLKDHGCQRSPLKDLVQMTII
jgi:hypothetical protein